MNQASRRRAAVKNVGGGKNGTNETAAATEGKQGGRGCPSNGNFGKNCNLNSAEIKRKLWSVSVDGAEKSPLHPTKLRSISYIERISQNSKEIAVCRETRAVPRSLSSSFRREKVGSEESGGKYEELRREMEVREDEKHVDEERKEVVVVEVEEEEEEEEEEEQKRLVVMEVNLSGCRTEVVLEDIKENHSPQATPTIANSDLPEIPFDFSNPISCQEAYEGASETRQKMRGLVDMVLWRDISRSAFVFGSGTFLLLSSSYAKDLNFSLISAISYVGLLYLAIVFIHKSILCKEALSIDEINARSALCEEDAIWFIRLVLPYLNEILFRVKCVFSGDPATTIKVAVLLFLLARCGSSITMWTLARFGFFGVFTIPKVYTSYSVQLTRYGRFWIGRFRDAWDSCSHKKAAAIAIFTVIWNLSSVVARVWAGFILVVAVRLYQQSQSSRWDEAESSAEAASDVKEAGKCKAQSPKGKTQKNNESNNNSTNNRVQEAKVMLMNK